MKTVFGAIGLVILATCWLSAQRPPASCSEIVGDLYIQAAQQQRQDADLRQQLAEMKQELAKYKTAAPEAK